MTAEAQTSGTVRLARTQRHDAGTIRLSQRDIDGLPLCGEHYGAPLDLLAEALDISQVRMNAITEVELSAKQIERTTQIITEMLSSMKYATVVYLTAPAARSAVRHAVASLPAEYQAKVAIRDLPANAFHPKARR
jgi:hypothetical protein